MKVHAILLFVVALFLALQFKAEAASPALITLAWNPSANAATYTLYWGSQSGNYSLNQSCPASQTNLTVNISTNQVYYFAVTASDARGDQSPRSAEVVYNPALPSGPPGVPTGLAVSGPPGGGPTASATWNSVINATGYELYWGTASGQYTLSNNCASPQISLNVTGLLTNQTYYFAVAALGSGTQSALSSPFAYANALATNSNPTNTSPTNTLTQLPSPGNFAEIAVTNNGIAGLALSWGSVAGALGYGLDWGTNSGAYLWSSNCPASQTEVTLTNLIGGETYYLAVKALSSAGSNNSAFSTELVYTNPMGVPANLTVSSASGSVVASWSPVADAAGYAVFYGSQAGDYLLGGSCGGGQTSLSLTNLMANDIYYFAVAAIATNGGQGPYSPEVIFTNTVAGFSKLAPLATRVVPGSVPNTAIVTWGPQANNGTYVLYEWPGTLANYQNDDPTSAVYTQASTEVTGLAPNQSYVFIVYAVDASIWGAPVAYSNSANVISPPAGLAVSFSNGGVVASWRPVANAAGYSLFYGSQSRIYLMSQTCGGDQTSVLVTPPLSGDVYYFAVSAMNGNGNQSAYSPEVVFTNTASAATTEAPPLAAGVAPGSAPNTAVVTWTPEADVSTYVLFQWPGTLANYQNNNSTSTVATGTNLAIAGLSPGQNYVFAVYAIDASIWGAPVSYLNAAPITPAFPSSTNHVPGIPPMVAMSFSNQQPALVISGTVGAQVKIQATTNMANPLAWTSINTITLTNAATNPDADSTNALPALVAAAFVPAAQVYLPAISPGAPAQAYRVSMPYDYATLAYQVLPAKNYPTRLIGVYMLGLTNNVCYIANDYNYIYCDPQTFDVVVQSSGPAIRQIATSLAAALNQSWTSAVELSYTNGGYQLLATVVETNPPSSDQMAGQQSPTSIQINF